MAVDTDVAGMAILQKAGAIINVLEREGESSAAQISEAVGEPVSSTYRLLSTMMALGWVDTGSKRGRYRLGVDVLRIGGMLEDRLDVRSVASPILAELRDATRNSTFLCLLRHDNAVCVERIGGRDVQSLAMRLGDSLPLYSGAAPRALLSFLPNEELRATLDRFEARRRNGEAIPSEGSILREIEIAREVGYTVSDEDVTPGIASIGAPIYNHRGELEGGISVSGLRDRVLGPDVDTAEKVKRSAAQISRALGKLEDAQ
ncbi:IclR family transcriptional regulator [Gulosibacter chungangensis]|uniref:IclR family transcriptional regulator n=1 Tax=Gulosibacter chungangensis TaxID=979746 RepID=A0A7J5BBC1_9MICO|nr:IclR family transcriptional regulator [Gulosibacter chungangensis]KAB1643406.1 IclR family transcriptional regulator [Gulosibacter chungangensis]